MPKDTNPALSVAEDASVSELLDAVPAMYQLIETAISRSYGCREASLAITNLQQSHMWWLKSVEAWNRASEDAHQQAAIPPVSPGDTVTGT